MMDNFGISGSVAEGAMGVFNPKESVIIRLLPFGQYNLFSYHFYMRTPLFEWASG